MKLSRRGVLALMAEEAVSLGAYRDGGGVWTIGVGHTAFAGAPKPVKGKAPAARGPAPAGVVEIDEEEDPADILAQLDRS